MKIKYHLSIFISISLVLVSCVSKKSYRKAQDTISSLQSDSMNCQGTLNDCKQQVKILESDKAALQNANSSYQNELINLSSKSKMTIAEQAKRLKNLQDLIQNQKDVMNNLKRTISDALISFDATELSVYIKDGNVYISLEEKLLFKSGSAVVDAKGKDALIKLVQVLKNTNDINVLVEGHTDSIPIKTTKFEDNWSLSTARALSIIRIMTM